MKDFMPGPLLRSRLPGQVSLHSKITFQRKTMGCAVQRWAQYASAVWLWVLCHWDLEQRDLGRFSDVEKSLDTIRTQKIEASL